MLKTKMVIIFTALIIFGCSQKNSTESRLIVNVSPPKKYSSEDSIHIVGSFNDWSLEGPNAYALKTSNGVLTASIPITEKNVFFTFVKNKSWQSMPANEMGKSECTYLYQAKDISDSIHIQIPLWKGDEPLISASHTLTGNIKQHPDFDMPQLKRKGNVAVYLPPSYSQDDNENYPVLYMLDGQNIFDNQTAYNNEWNIDERLEQLIPSGELPEMIVISVPNGEQRWSEYNPWDFKNNDGKQTEGNGRLTIDFITKTLKPFIDKTYRTKITNESTGLAGSSLGGLMALYAALEYSDTFGFVAAFSPALSIENMAGNNVLFEAIKQKQKLGNTKIYIDMGLMEYGNYEKIEQLNMLLLNQGLKPEHLNVVKDDLGRHCEIDWSKRFPDALKWLTTSL